MKYNITFDNKPSPDDTAILWEGISKYAQEMRGHKPGGSYAFFIKDERNKIKGGCSGFMFYGCLFVDLLWVDSGLRNQGWGRQLMLETERLAKQNNCHFIAVNTMDWEALNFYLKLGFYVEFERRGFDKESIFYFLRKNLTK